MQTYGFVAELSKKLPQIRKQAIVMWAGSPSDKKHFDDVQVRLDRLQTLGVTIYPIFMSGHKSTRRALDQLHTLEDMADQGVIIALVERSNGLGPILAAHSLWPVISVPADLESFPSDVFSSLRLPSGVPMTTTWPLGNAIDAATVILSATNPLLHAERIMAREELDD